MQRGVEIEGLTETLKAFQGLEQDLRKKANAELRDAARTCATELAAQLAQAAMSSGVPVAPKLAKTIRVRSDRMPVVAIGGGEAAGALWGSEHGPMSDPNRFAVDPNPSGYWITPTVQAFQGNQAVDRYKRGVYDTMHRWGLV